MVNVIETIGKGSVIQHCKLSDRVYLMKLKEEDCGIILDEISKLVNKHKYSKVFCKIPKHIAPLFFADGFILEAFIPRFYNNREDVFFVSKFLDPDRLLKVDRTQLQSLNLLLAEKPQKTKKTGSSDYIIRNLTESDIGEITRIYRTVFESYPFPIYDPDYVLKTMRENVRYFGAEKEGKLAALSSSEMDIGAKNVEMTDFATDPDHLGNHLSGLLLAAMEPEMKRLGITTLYTIARLNSIPMNKTFLRAGYQYSGTLINNTNIAGKIESMNVYYKHI